MRRFAAEIAHGPSVHCEPVLVRRAVSAATIRASTFARVPGGSTAEAAILDEALGVLSGCQFQEQGRAIGLVRVDVAMPATRSGCIAL
jgi:hypothetical protein